MIKKYLDELKQFDRETLLIIVFSTFILLFTVYFRGFKFIFPHERFLNRLVVSGVIFGMSPFVMLLVFRHKPKDFGISLGNVKLWSKEVLFFYLIMVAILLVAFKFTNLKHTYPLYRNAAKGMNYFFMYQGIQLFHMLTWEFFFRGFMLFSLEKKVGSRMSILIQTIPFAIMHFRKPQLEAYGSIFAGIFLGIIAYRGRSFLPCFLLHFAVALTADIIGILF